MKHAIPKVAPWPSEGIERCVVVLFLLQVWICVRGQATLYGSCKLTCLAEHIRQKPGDLQRLNGLEQRIGPSGLRHVGSQEIRFTSRHVYVALFGKLTLRRERQRHRQAGGLRRPVT